ncbi:MAG: response regulator [Pyrinomonadaceae bacterium]
MSKTILVVEDFEDARQMIKFLLEDMGYEVLEAEDGWKAVESVKRRKPDLIFMDMALPKMNGLSATKIIRELKETSNTPIIALTASGEYLYQQALEAGCNDFITKPLDIDKLKPIIEKHLPNSSR